MGKTSVDQIMKFIQFLYKESEIILTVIGNLTKERNIINNRFKLLRDHLENEPNIR